MADFLFVFADGDQVRSRVERLLFSGELDALSRFSRSLVAAVEELQILTTAKMSAEVIVAAGDDLLVRVKQENYDRSLVVDMAKTFEKISGCTLSVGVGPSVESAYICLRCAKSQNGSHIIEKAIDHG